MILKNGIILFILILIISCNSHIKKDELKVRELKDTIGFTQYNWQLDSILFRIDSVDLHKTSKTYTAVICPHDDYKYAAGLFNKTLNGVKAKTIILFGVAHRARKFNLENKLVFGSFDSWKSANGLIKVSPLRDKLIKKLKKETFIVHDSMMQLEHSLEAINPFLQRNNPKVEIIPVLIPYMTFDEMKLFSDEMSKAVFDLIKEKKLTLGKDVAIVISNDAIHYGDEGWGGENMAPFGVDSIGTEKARLLDLEIINNCLTNEIVEPKIQLFNKYTVKGDNYKEYKWTWCGRYSVPFGLLFANKLNKMVNNKNLQGTLIDYRTTIHNKHIKVEDLNMGVTAPANQHHWVAFTGISYN
jgi:AmmeMemoRadiSam system protein B